MGVKNITREIIGSSFKYDTEVDGEVFKHYLSRNLNPNIVLEFEEFDIDAKRVVALTIPAAENVVTEFDKERYFRDGSSKVLLRKYPKHEAKLWMILSGAEPTLTNAPSTRQDLTFRVFKIYLDESDVHYNDANFNKNNNLLTGDGKYNQLAFLLSDQYDYPIKIARFSGKNKMSDFVERIDFGGRSLLKSLDGVADYVKLNINRSRAYFDPGVITRRDEYLFGNDSFREAWTNAVLHNDYSTQLAPSIYVFSDHIEVFSYGNPLSVQSKEDFLDGVSKPINPKLMDIFMKIHKSESSGKGVNTIKKKYGEAAFVMNSESFTVSLSFNELALEDNVPQDVPQQSEIDIIIEAIKKNPNITRAELAKLIGKTVKTVGRIIASCNKIVFKGHAKSGHWEVID